MTYFGVSLANGRLKASHLEPLVAKVRAKVASWKTKLLSQAVKLILLKHVLSSMVSHLLAVMNVPKVVLTKLNTILSNFYFFFGRVQW